MVSFGDDKKLGGCPVSPVTRLTVASVLGDVFLLAFRGCTLIKVARVPRKSLLNTITAVVSGVMKPYATFFLCHFSIVDSFTMFSSDTGPCL